METIRFDVVGLYHWDVRDRWKAYATEAVGKQLTVQPQPDNLKDPLAIRAREGSLHVGYVAVPDQGLVYKALHGAGKQRLRGVVVESNPEPPVLTVEAKVERIDWDYEPFDDSLYEGWRYKGLPLMPPKLEQLGDLTADLTDELEGSLPNRDESLNQGTIANRDGGLEDGVTNRDTLQELTTRLIDSNLYDMSREMTNDRYHIEQLLAQCSDPELQTSAKKLRQQKGMLMRHENRDRVARYLFNDLPRQLDSKGLVDSHYTYDNQLDELEQQLRTFPYQLYDKFENDPVDFLREVYYKHVPREHLNALLSGIVLMILKGRVKIKRWGREGDTEPIRLIEQLGQSPEMRPSVRENPVPAAFSDKAAVYWERLEQQGFVDSNRKLMPSTTRMQAMYIADHFANLFGMKARWKPFEQLWGIKNLAQEKYAYLEKGQTISRSEDIENIFRQ